MLADQFVDDVPRSGLLLSVRSEVFLENDQRFPQRPTARPRPGRIIQPELGTKCRTALT